MELVRPLLNGLFWGLKLEHKLSSPAHKGIGICYGCCPHFHFLIGRIGPNPANKKMKVRAAAVADADAFMRRRREFMF
jgi:hypothetical protein